MRTFVTGEFLITNASAFTSMPISFVPLCFKSGSSRETRVTFSKRSRKTLLVFDFPAEFRRRRKSRFRSLREPFRVLLAPRARNILFRASTRNTRLAERRKPEKKAGLARARAVAIIELLRNVCAYRYATQSIVRETLRRNYSPTGESLVHSQ